MLGGFVREQQSFAKNTNPSIAAGSWSRAEWQLCEFSGPEPIKSPFDPLYLIADYPDCLLMAR